MLVSRNYFHTSRRMGHHISALKDTRDMREAPCCQSADTEQARQTGAKQSKYMPRAE